MMGIKHQYFAIAKLGESGIMCASYMIRIPMRSNAESTLSASSCCDHSFTPTDDTRQATGIRSQLLLSRAAANEDNQATNQIIHQCVIKCSR